MTLPAASDAASAGDLETTRRLVMAHGTNATAYQLINPGIARWFDADRRAVVGFVDASGYRIVAGSPVCAGPALGEVVEAFESATRAVGKRTCYFAADDTLADHLRRRGPFDRVLLGAQPVWDPAAWPSILARKASLRAQLNRARNKNVVVARWSAAAASGHPELRRCLDEWLATRGLPPLHFLVEPDTLSRLFDRRVFVARQDDRAVAFLVASPVPRRQGWLVEQTVRGRDAPNGTSELLLDAAMRQLGDEGATFLTLGLSPLSIRSGLAPARQRLWLRALLGWMRAHGRRFYDFEGLDAYKAKFLPERWEPIWAITGGHRVGPRTLYAIAAAFGRTSPLLLGARALVRAAGREMSWMRKRIGRRDHRRPTR